jgi:hypothetical protein
LDALNDAQVAAVAGDCATYFDRYPYRRWFDPLDRLLRAGLGVSYYQGTACHLDLVAWATDPVWGSLDTGARTALLQDGLAHLRDLLDGGRVRVVVLNGRQVLDQVAATGLVALTEVDRLPLGRSTCRLVRGASVGITYLGWSTNLQSGRGVTTAFTTGLAGWLATTLTPAAPGPEQDTRPIAAVGAPTTQTGQPHADGALAAADILTVDGHLPPGIVVRGKHELVQTLGLWLARSQTTTIGNVATFGGRPHLRLHLRLGPSEVEAVLNADTTRAAVTTYLQIAQREGEDATWQVTANRRGVINKIIPTTTTGNLPGWYCYLTTPLARPRRL